MSEKKTQLQSWETIKSTAEVLYNSFVNSVTTNSQTGLKSFNSKKLEKLQSFLKENKTSYRKLNLDGKKIKEILSSRTMKFRKISKNNHNVKIITTNEKPKATPKTKLDLGVYLKKQNRIKSSTQNYQHEIVL
jgi:hypothetical protein